MGSTVNFDRQSRRRAVEIANKTGNYLLGPEMEIRNRVTPKRTPEHSFLRHHCFAQLLGQFELVAGHWLASCNWNLSPRPSPFRRGEQTSGFGDCLVSHPLTLQLPGRLCPSPFRERVARSAGRGYVSSDFATVS